MKIRLKKHSPNAHVLEIGDFETDRASYVEVLFSYETPVAAFVAGESYIRSRHRYSATTSKHISQYLDGAPAREVSQEEIDALLLEVRTASRDSDAGGAS